MYFNFLSFVGIDYKFINLSYVNIVDVFLELFNKVLCEFIEIFLQFLMRVKINNGKVIFCLVYY